jgi:uncharacterized protein YndB with AHSA1/START domain
MPTVEAHVSIAAPPESVVSVLLDADLAPKWTRGLDRLELVEGAVGQAGSVGLAHYVEGRRRYTLHDRLVSVTPGRRYVSEITGGGLKATVETTLEPLADGTRMSVKWVGRGTNPISGLAIRLMKPLIAKRSKDDLDSLCRLVETTRA